MGKVEAAAQGSILGLLLFLIYINDLSERLRLKSTLSAHNTLLFFVVIKNVDLLTLITT